MRSRFGRRLQALYTLQEGGGLLCEGRYSTTTTGRRRDVLRWVSGHHGGWEYFASTATGSGEGKARMGDVNRVKRKVATTERLNTLAR
jgi:hypothetical protein